ncbi:MAG: heme anaerobic degradation radical SAM methyltransferase ChuW/HutW [Candidatus Accumulibacter sp.]|jgi:oxygen-independent coproporphyrinogen-3 oxidase|nr:heme anaerobic degradation radical SAM methyltransferase ChuW/HutW [Accumulibacter sp.]
MKPIEAFFARICDDPVGRAFDEEEKSFSPTVSMQTPPAWEGGAFEDFAARAFVENAHRSLVLYVHVPFCRRRCAFCPFFKNISDALFSAEYTSLLAKEISDTAKTLGSVVRERPVKAIYFGGGTPSDLDSPDLALLIRRLRESFLIAPDAEITVEGRVRGFTGAKGKAWVDAGANRFSLGVQTADTRLRRRMGRIADRDEIRAVMNALGESGAALVLDLIYGFPEQTEEILLDDIRFVSEETGIHGLDLYKLSLFPGSPLDKAIVRGEFPKPPDFAQRAKMYELAYGALLAHGFEPFTPKHWRRDAKERSVYNRLAFGQTDMIPFGSGAGGRIGSISLGNAGVLADYGEKVLSGKKPIARLALSPPKSASESFGRLIDEALEELRLPAIERWPQSHREKGKELLSQWREAGLLHSTDSQDESARLTCAGNFWAPHMKKLLIDFAAQTW